jgi:hypothetical protein
VRDGGGRITLVQVHSAQEHQDVLALAQNASRGSRVAGNCRGGEAAEIGEPDFSGGRTDGVCGG